MIKAIKTGFQSGEGNWCTTTPPLPIERVDKGVVFLVTGRQRAAGREGDILERHLLGFLLALLHLRSHRHCQQWGQHRSRLQRHDVALPMLRYNHHFNAPIVDKALGEPNMTSEPLFPTIPTTIASGNTRRKQQVLSPFFWQGRHALWRWQAQPARHTRASPTNSTSQIGYLATAFISDKAWRFRCFIKQYLELYVGQRAGLWKKFQGQ